MLLELEEQRLLQEIEKVDKAVVIIKDDYERLRLQELS